MPSETDGQLNKHLSIAFSMEGAERFIVREDLIPQNLTPSSFPVLSLECFLHPNWVSNIIFLQAISVGTHCTNIPAAKGLPACSVFSSLGGLENQSGESLIPPSVCHQRYFLILRVYSSYFGDVKVFFFFILFKSIDSVCRLAIYVEFNPSIMHGQNKERQISFFFCTVKSQSLGSIVQQTACHQGQHPCANPSRSQRGVLVVQYLVSQSVIQWLK